MTAAPVLARLAALADPTRARLLHVLDGQELTVAELCAVVQLPQSTVSRHLKVLAEEEWVAHRAAGTSRYYRFAARAREARRLWELVRDEVAGAGAARDDGARLEAVLAERRSRSQEFFSAAALEWDALRAELFGRRLEEAAAFALLEPDLIVGDLGCGTGQLAAALAPHVGSVIAVDDSRSMLAAARTRLDGCGNVQLRRGALESLPVADGELDAAIMMLVLHYAADPAAVLRESARAVRPGGRLVLIDMLPHDREELRERMGHVWPGFDEPAVLGWLAEAGFEAASYRPMPADPAARGPLLFTATARRVAGASAVRQVPTIRKLESR